MLTKQFLRFALCGLFLAALSGPASAARIYQLVNYPDLQNGHTLTGTITTTDDAPDDGLLVAAEILGWEWSVSGANSLAGSYTPPPGPQSVNADVHMITISTETIELPLLTNASLQLRQPPIAPGRGSPAPAMLWGHTFDVTSGTVQPKNIAGFGAGDVFEAFWSTNLANADVSSWIIATAIPEPSSLILGFCAR